MYDFFEDPTSTLTFLFASTVPIALVSFFWDGLELHTPRLACSFQYV